MIYTHRCDPCNFTSDVVQAMAEEPRTNCPLCDGSTFLRRVTKTPAMKIGHSIRKDLDYREDLSRFPGDPEAIVDGPRSLHNLIELRKRQGWTMQPLDNARSATPPTTDPNRNFAREAYEAAKANGFKTEE